MSDKMIKNAVFSDCRKYRYVLERTWDNSLPKIMWIGLNPSEADEHHDDSTIKKCIHYTKKEGFGGFYMLNLFAFVDKYQDVIYQVDDPIGLENDLYLKKYACSVDKIIAAWGNNGCYRGRSTEVCRMFDKLYCLKLNNTGEPHHPLYLKGDINLQEYIRKN
ncbi:DUF1643 domain-containing protein [Pasteurellaceae bacterium TAE3-ERU1]|uniref:DUF1643 domain-containing protein n=1 Tax=Spirabiliibacterium mucosae TaxID=28156 RepID=UPI001AAE0C83|nr:DUF1643 domain-containing protein [Spirabiliibacterium mucosae]MBE2898461.1 DUF1643 domain-containing protein [Spirabiliibacterium mucosae]MBV7388241.1 DUF1643 domain-containing protein [Pasteurellaceae bacterium TAE3-ERU1]